MEKLELTSTRLQYLVVFFIFLVPSLMVLSIVTGTWAEFLNIPPGILVDESRITGVNILVLVVLGSIKPLSYIIAFLLLYRMLGLYRAGIIFTEKNVLAIRKLGWSLVIIDIATMIQSLISGPVLSYFQITSAYVTVGLESSFLVVGLFIVLIAYVMDMGRELKEQDSLVI